ncbi:ABC transporter permease [Aliidongia dinghuensis]|uniref:Glutamate/aspartate import permease protein GltK n=1 Tax=Aliidongia dinghuensis TaxID=1867774 RepID=A0A8J3E607_9PROT|nr:amino acid ABC transporter permease [Aliidongia dinghuensis]GGF25772.1 ABC transporter permease [Aliidongia dinghuensis]
MNYIFQFGEILKPVNFDELLWGMVYTLRLSAISMVLSLAFAIGGALLRTSGPKWIQTLVIAYVEVIRNTPFLVQIFMIFFGLPTVGLSFDANTAAVIAMVLNGSAYTIEIVRAGIESVTHGQMEAARALGLHTLQSFRLVVLPQALKVMVAPLGSQFILLMLNSSIVSVVSADELMAAAQDVQSRTFRPFETYIIVFVIYFIVSMIFQAAFALIDRWAFPRVEHR